MAYWDSYITSCLVAHLCVRLNNFLKPFCGIPVVFFVLITIFLACNKIFEIKILVHVPIVKTLRRHITYLTPVVISLSYFLYCLKQYQAIVNVLIIIT